MTLVLTLLLAAFLLLGASDVARADPVSAAILGFLGITATKTAIAITTLVLTLGANIGLALLQRMFIKKPDAPTFGTAGKLQASGVVPRSFVIGRAAADISLVYANTFGQSGKTPNAYLVQVIACSDLPVTGLAELWVNGIKCTYDPEATPETEGIPIPEFATEPSFGGSKNHLWVRFYDGTQTAADARLVELFGSDPDYPYGSNRVGEGIAYLVVTALLNEEIFTGFPQVKPIIDGIRLYDPRDDDTAGGSGDQRYDDPATHAFRGDPVTQIYNVLRGIRYDGEWFWGGQTTTVTRVPFASFAPAANECDVAIDLDAGGTEPQFRTGAAVRVDMQPVDVIEALLRGCLGRMAEIGGVYKIRVGAPASPVASFDSSVLLTTESGSFKPFPTQPQTVNAVGARYVSTVEAWNLTDAPELRDPALEAADGGRRLPATIDLGVVSSPTQAQRIVQATRNDHRRFRTHVWPLPPSLLHLEPLDVVAVTSPEDGYSNKLFEVVSGTDLATLDCVRALREVDPADYDWNPETDERPVDPTPISPIRPPPQPVTGWQVFPHTGEKGPTIRVEFAADLDDVRAVMIQVRLASTLDLIFEADFPYGEPLPSGTRSVVLNGVFARNTDYEVRARLRPFGGRATQWTSWLPVTTPDTPSVDFGDLDGAIRDLQNWIGQGTRDLIDELLQRATGNVEEMLQRYRDVQSVRVALAAVHENVTASYLDAITVAVGPDSALAQRITVLEAVIGDAGAGAFSALVARVDATEDGIVSIAEALTSVSAASVTGDVATANFRMSVSAGPDGYAARIGMEARAGGSGTYRSASLFLDVPNSDAEPTRIVCLADQFVITDGSSLEPPFVVDGGTVYVNDLKVRGQSITDGAATQWWRGSNSIAFAQVLSNGDILVSVDVSVAGRTSSATVGDVEIFVTSPKVRITSTSSNTFQFQLQRDGSTIRASQYVATSTTAYDQNDYTMYWLDPDVSVGSHTYRIRYAAIAGGGTPQNDMNPWDIRIIVKELRR